MMVTALAQRIVRDDLSRVATLTKARKLHRCAECQEYIEKGEQYYSVIVGMGLGAIKFPSRVHHYCLDNYFGRLENERD